MKQGKKNGFGITKFLDGISMFSEHKDGLANGFSLIF